MAKDIFNPESQPQHCDDFMRQIDAAQYPAVNFLGYIATELQMHVPDVRLRAGTIYAHCLFGGNPLVSLPFVNEANPDDTSIPLSHRNAAYMTTQKYELTWDIESYWSLYLFRSLRGGQFYGVTWLAGSTSEQISSFKKMLRLMPRLHLFSASTRDQKNAYVPIGPTNE